MSHSNDLRIVRLRPSAAPKAIKVAYPTPRIVPLLDAHPDRRESDEQDQPEGNQVAASTGGQLQSAYAQFVVDPNTHDVLLRVRDAATHRILQEVPSVELQAMSRNLTEYGDMLARRSAGISSSKDA
jgi:hypothetical protein